MFPYLDNDIASYPHLYEYIRMVHTDLGAKVRISTVGYSRHNRLLHQMHSRIAHELGAAIAGIRFSFTPYPVGLQREESLLTSKREFIADFANLLATYRPLVKTLGEGKETACVELRFPPLAIKTPVFETSICDHHVIRAGPHLLVRVRCGGDNLERTLVDQIIGSKPAFTTEPTPYLLITDDDVENGWQALVRSMIEEGSSSLSRVRQVNVYCFENADGRYYAVDPTFAADGTFRALHIYPCAHSRTTSGYTDGTRLLLNTLVSYKRSHGKDRRDQFPEANWDNVAHVLSEMCREADTRASSDSHWAFHQHETVIPLVRGFVEALKQAGYPASAFFDPRFTIDTGQIVNQGRARKLFHGLTEHDDEPMTPLEERGYGKVSISSERGLIWRIAPVPSARPGLMSKARIGGKNDLNIAMALQVQELHPRHLRAFDPDTHQPLRQFFIKGLEVEHVHLESVQDSFAIPGARIV